MACYNTCGNDCNTSCSTTCASVCTGSCTGHCQGECLGCKNTCLNTCNNTCEGSCKLSCSEECWGCSGTCEDSCASICVSGCGSKCDGSCVGDCFAGCQSKCDSGCSGKCGDTCNNTSVGSFNLSVNPAGMIWIPYVTISWTQYSDNDHDLFNTLYSIYSSQRSSPLISTSIMTARSCYDYATQWGSVGYFSQRYYYGRAVDADTGNIIASSNSTAPVYLEDLLAPSNLRRISKSAITVVDSNGLGTTQITRKLTVAWNASTTVSKTGYYLEAYLGGTLVGKASFSLASVSGELSSIIDNAKTRGYGPSIISLRLCTTRTTYRDNSDWDKCTKVETYPVKSGYIILNEMIRYVPYPTPEYGAKLLLSPATPDPSVDINLFPLTRYKLDTPITLRWSNYPDDCYGYFDKYRIYRLGDELSQFDNQLVAEVPGSQTEYVLDRLSPSIWGRGIVGKLYVVAYNSTYNSEGPHSNYISLGLLPSNPNIPIILAPSLSAIARDKQLTLKCPSHPTKILSASPFTCSARPHIIMKIPSTDDVYTNLRIRYSGGKWVYYSKSPDSFKLSKSQITGGTIIYFKFPYDINEYDGSNSCDVEVELFSKKYGGWDSDNLSVHPLVPLPYARCEYRTVRKTTIEASEYNYINELYRNLIYYYWDFLTEIGSLTIEAPHDMTEGLTVTRISLLALTSIAYLISSKLPKSQSPNISLDDVNNSFAKGRSATIYSDQSNDTSIPSYTYKPDSFNTVPFYTMVRGTGCKRGLLEELKLYVVADN